MARGEGRTVSKAEPAADVAPPITRTVARLMSLIGGLRGPGYRLRLGASLVLTLFSKILAVVSPLVLADGINALSEGRGAGALPAFIGFAGFWAALRLASTAGPQVRDAIFQPISEEAQRRAGTRVFTHVHSLSVRFHQSKRTGAVYRTIERGVRAIDFLLRFLAFNIAPTVIELLLAAGVLGFKYGWQFSLIAGATVFIYAWITFGITEWRLQHRREMNEADTEAAGRAVDSLLNFETVKSFAAEGRESERYDRALASYASAAVRAYNSLVLLNILQSVIMTVGLLGMVLAAGWLVASGPMGPGDITAVILIMTNLYAPLNILGFAYREIKQTSIDMEKMFTLLDEEPDVADAPDAAALKPARGEVSFENVSFAHEGRDVGLDGVSFVAPAGKTTAIVGPSGAGKSTVLKLLFRFYDPSGGRVSIDGQDLRGVTQASLRGTLGLVPQDVVLFNDTIRYNIGYGNPNATQQELDEVIRVLRGDHLAFARLEKLVSNREIELNEKQQGLMWKLKNPEQRERFLNISAANPDAEKSTKFPTRKIGIALMVAVALIIFYVSRSAIYCLVFNYGHCPEQSKPEPPKPEPPKPEPPKPEPPKPEPLMPKPLRPKPQKFKRQKCSELWRQCNAQISRCAAWKKNCADAPSLTALPAPDDASAKIKSMLAELVTIQSIGSQDSRSLAPIQALPRMIRNVAAILRKGNRKDAIELCGKLITRFDGYMRKSSFSLSEEKTIEPSCEILMQVDHATIDVLLTACGKANYYYNKHKDALTAKCQQYQSVFPP